MKEGLCPKCGSANVCTGTYVFPKRGLSDGNVIPVTAMTNAVLDNYVCVDCGFVESYVTDPSKLAKIAEKWPRVREGVRQGSESQAD